LSMIQKWNGEQVLIDLISGVEDDTLDMEEFRIDFIQIEQNCSSWKNPGIRYVFFYTISSVCHLFSVISFPI